MRLRVAPLFAETPLPGKLPPPMALFAAVMLEAEPRARRSGLDPRVQVIPLERTRDRLGVGTLAAGMVCGWTRDLRHSDHGMLAPAARPGLADAAIRLLQEQPPFEPTHPAGAGPGRYRDAISQ